MHYLKQPENSNQCGQTCVAMIADITIERSLEVFGKKGCTTTKDVIRALRALGIQCGDKLLSSRRNKKTGVCMAVLHFKGTTNEHWTVWWDGIYLDPADGVGDRYSENVWETSFLPIWPDGGGPAK